METTGTAVGVGVSDALVGICISLAAILIADVGERNEADAHAHMAEGPEACHDVIEVGIAGVDLLAAFLEVGELPADTYVEDETQRVDGRIGSGVQLIHLVVLAEGKAEAVHATVETAGLISQFAQTKLRVRRIGSAIRLVCISCRLCTHRQRKCCQNDSATYSFHYTVIFCLIPWGRENRLQR